MSVLVTTITIGTSTARARLKCSSVIGATPENALKLDKTLAKIIWIFRPSDYYKLDKLVYSILK